jgi:hypothetical protein
MAAAFSRGTFFSSTMVEKIGEKSFVLIIVFYDLFYPFDVT